MALCVYNVVWVIGEGEVVLKVFAVVVVSFFVWQGEVIFGGEGRRVGLSERLMVVQATLFIICWSFGWICYGTGASNERAPVIRVRLSDMIPVRVVCESPIILECIIS